MRKRAPCERGQRGVQEIARRRRDDQAAFRHISSGHNGEKIVGAVADQDGLGVDAQDAAGGLAEGGADRVGVATQ